MNELIDNLLSVPKKETTRNTPTTVCHVDKANAVHQIDLLFLPMDKGFKYALVVVDVFSGMTEAEKLKTKTAREVIKALTKIYNRGVLSIPFKLEADPGKEFMGDFNRYARDNEIVIKRGKPNRHRQQSLVERRNRIISQKIFRRQTQQELLTGQASTQWVDDLPTYIEEINKEIKTKKKPCDPNDIKWAPRCDGKACDLLPEGTRVRAILDHPIDPATGKRIVESNGRFRATDIRWNPEIRTINKIVLNPNQPPMYILNDNGKDAEIGYTRNQLQVVPDKEKNPPKSVLRGAAKNPKQKFVIEPSGEGINLEFFPDNVKQWLEKYSNSKIHGLYVGKMPIRKIYSDMLKILSKGKLEEIMKELKYDHLYHTFILYHLKDDNSMWLVERNGRLSVKAYNPMVKHEEFGGQGKFLPIITTDKTVSEMFSNHERLIGGWEKLVWYNPVTNNCQKFINNHLKSNGLLTNEIEKFVNQKLKTVMKDYSITRQFLQHVISLGIIIENYLNF
jgi:hypothetical protein